MFVFVAIHNILFGQLGTLAFTMHEMGLEKAYVSTLMCVLFCCSTLWYYDIKFPFLCYSTRLLLRYYVVSSCYYACL